VSALKAQDLGFSRDRSFTIFKPYNGLRDRDLSPKISTPTTIHGMRRTHTPVKFATGADASTPVSWSNANMAVLLLFPFTTASHFPV
jgi:hypothetical protein